MPSRKTPLILDTDMSPDSWIAVLFAALHPDANLLAVSVSGTGEAHGPRGARNARRLLSLAGKTDVRVGFGPPDPLKGSEHFPWLMRFIIDRLLWQRVPQSAQPAPAEDSIKMISEILRASKEKITFAAVGPQTNLATVLSIHPELKKKVKAVHIMGGALDAPGNIREVASWKKNTTAEWNFFCDPLAAKTVIDSTVPVYLVPLDATNQIPVTVDFVERLRSAGSSPAAEFAANLLHLLVVRLRAGAGFFLWDPITTACALDEKLAEFSKRLVDVVTDPGEDWGRVFDSHDGTEINAANTLDRARFEETIIRVLNRQRILRNVFPKTKFTVKN